MAFKLPDLSDNSWGPSSETKEAFSDLPFAPFSKEDPINHVADWYGTGKIKTGRAKMGDENAMLGDFLDNDDDDEFGAVVRQRTYDKNRRKDPSRQLQQMVDAHSKLTAKAAKKLTQAPTGQAYLRKKQQQKKKKKKVRENPRPQNASIKKQDNWVDVQDIWMNTLLEQDIPAPGAPENITSAGKLHNILSQYDDVTCKHPVPLNFQKYDDNLFLHFDHTTACQDPIMQELALKKQGNVYTTDTVLAILMNAPRSKYSWDIVINKFGNTIFLDQREGANSQLSVDETSLNRPTEKASQKNRLSELALEATYINHVFSEQIVSHKPEKIKNLERNHPFANVYNNNNNNNQTPASTCYFYKKYILPNNIDIICRCHVNGYENNDEDNYVSVFALNQYDHIKQKTSDWEKDLETKNASILLTEIRNNNFKCARWATEAMLASARTIKLGFVSRIKNNTDSHHIVGVKSMKGGDFYKVSMGLEKQRQWGIAFFFIQLCKKLEDGRFVAIRDPLKQVIRIYSVESDAFGKDKGNLPTIEQMKNTMRLTQQQQQQNNDDNNK